MSYAQAQPLYVVAGWRGVLPLPPRAKGPPPVGYTGRGAPEPEYEQLARWETEQPEANLALRLPPDVLGLDVDAYDGKPGVATLTALEAELGNLPQTYVSSARPAPSGIRLYRVPPGLAWHDPGPGVEVIHHGWRYAVVWPSTHPTGAQYVWSHYGTAAALPRVEELPELPPAWVQRLAAGEATPYVEGSAGLEWLAVAPVGPCPIMAESTARHRGEIEAGAGRHDSMMRAQRALVELGVNGHRGVAPALEELRDAFHGVTTDRSTWGEWDRALRGAIAKTGASTALQAPPCRCAEPPTTIQTGAVPPASYDGLYLSVEALAAIPRPVELITDCLDAGALFAITGRDGVYKSFLILDWLACLATGKDWLGHPVTPRKCLYVVGEGVFDLGARFTAWSIAHNRGIHPDWLSIRREPVSLFRPEAALEELLGRIRATGVGVVVFDTLQRMSSGADLNSARDASTVMATLDRVRAATGDGSVGFVAHTGKGDVDTRGSSVLEDDADVVWRVRHPEDDDVIAELHKRKAGPSGTIARLRPRIVAGTGSLVLDQATGRPTLTRPPRHALEALTVLGSRVAEDGLSSSALSAAIGLSGKQSLVDTLNWLLDQGLVSRAGKARATRYTITEAGRIRLTEVGR